ncbi:MAG: alpha/beta fold hydrolase [Actinomycetota bacterium]
MAPFRAILLPGSVLPAELAYASLVAALGSDAEVVAKELEVYATEEVPRDYTLDLEIAGALREADGRGWDRFHLVGYSGGGAAALAVAARHPERLSSLALLEPAWAGRWEMSPAEQALWREYDRIETLLPDEMMRAFMRLNVKPSVELPPSPSGDPPPWMAKRPGGIRAFMETFRTYDLDRDALRASVTPSTSRSADSATPISSARSPPGSAASSRTFDSRSSRNDITSTRPIGSNPSGSRTHCEQAGDAATG